MSILPSFITPAVALGATGGLLGSLRAFAYAKERGSILQSIMNVLIGMSAAASVSDRFISTDHPLTAVMLGIVTGSAGGYVLDAVKSLAPSLTRDFLRKLLGLPPLAEQSEDPQKGQ